MSGQPPLPPSRPPKVTQTVSNGDRRTWALEASGNIRFAFGQGVTIHRAREVTWALSPQTKIPPAICNPPPPFPAAVRMPVVVRMPACHSKGERPIGAATG